MLKIIHNRQFKRTNEPQPKGQAQEPDWLNDTERAVWREYAPQLIELGLLTGVDVEVFSVFCRLAAKVHTSAVVNPNDVAQLRLVAGCFGMEPSSRPRLATPAADQEKPKAKASLR